jgi:hypothetical protein
MSDCPNCTILMTGVDPRLALKCYPCYLGRTPAPAAERRSRRLAAKPRVDYYEAAIPSEATIRRRDQAKAVRAAERAEHRMVLNALRVKVRAQVAVARQDAANRRRAQQIVNRIERDAAILAAMPSTPPRLVRQDAEAPWAPPHGPALSRTEATGCADPNWIPFEPTPGALPSPPPLRRVCASPDCDEDCKRCRYNDRLAEFNRNRPLPTGPAFVPNLINPPAGTLAPPPIGATVVRIPIDMRLMSAAALHEIIAAASTALGGR